MDWDWEDGPPRDTPPSRRAPDETPAPREPAPSEPEWPESPEESETRVFSPGTVPERAPDEPPVQSPPPEYVLPDRTETGRPAPQSGAEFERPRAGTIESSERAAVADAGGSEGYERRSRSSEDRTARREQRRRQLRRRRLVALAVLIAIIVLIVVLIVRGCGGSDAGATAAVFVTVFVDRRMLVVPGRM